MKRRAAEESLTDHGKDNSNGRAHVGDAIRHKPGILGFLRQIGFMGATAYAKTLLALRKGDEADARTALAAAWKRNPHVPALLTGAMPIPEHQDDHYTLGSPDEAVIYVLQNRENWTATRGALQWLAETVQTLPPPDEKRP